MVMAAVLACSLDKMRCQQCGEEGPDGARFCPRCGGRLEDAAPPNLVGKTIAGRYRLLRQVGQGGMGSVYEGEQTLGSSHRSVAIKLLHSEWSAEPSVAARFLREAGTVARLEHFNTVRVYDFGKTEDGTLFLVMEYLEGRSLEHVLEQGALPAARVEHIVAQVAASLEEAHGLGITHRDLKPGNILLLENYAAQHDVIKLVDFGIAKSQQRLGHSGATKLTELGAFVGTPAYMSPEQFSATGAGPRSDIYSLAITTYQMLSGHLPFSAETALGWAQAHMNSAPPPLEVDYGQGPIPETMRRAVLRALNKDPEKRPGSAAQFARELGGRDDTERSREVLPTGSVVGAPTADAVAAGGMKTAPMLKLPEFGVPGAASPTLPMEEGRNAEPARGRELWHSPVALPPIGERGKRGRGLLWTALLGVLGLSLGMLFLFLEDPQLSLLRRLSGSREEASTPVSVAPIPRTEIEPEPVAPLPGPAPANKDPKPAPASPRPASPRPPTATPRPPTAPRPSTPTPETQPPAAAGAPATSPPNPATPVPTTPAPGTPGLPTPPGFPEPPWSAAAAGACERCLEEVRGRSHYAIVTAVAQNLLCEDRAGRERCEVQIREQAPELAEKAAREGDCAAAYSTMAAAVNVGVPSDSFRTLDTLCLR
jgi:predicted Ser/Thr protein kinase